MIITNGRPVYIMNGYRKKLCVAERIFLKFFIFLIRHCQQEIQNKWKLQKNMRQNTKYYITTKCTAGRPHPATTPSRMAGTRPPKLTNQDSPLSLAIGVSLFPMESQERKQRPWRTQYKCSRHSACHTRGARIGIGACAWVELPLLMDKEKPHNCRLLSDDQSITVRICQIIGNRSELLVSHSSVKMFWQMFLFKALEFSFPSIQVNFKQPGYFPHQR